ncbi:MAG: hypothetical protein EOO39_00485 [Cytophagaceae bacterium]|nr:MAG: hypothetical protein EOO39_00485 [Cytophagaceae bacterium]
MTNKEQYFERRRRADSFSLDDVLGDSILHSQRAIDRINQHIQDVRFLAIYETEEPGAGMWPDPQKETGDGDSQPNQELN